MASVLDGIGEKAFICSVSSKQSFTLTIIDVKVRVTQPRHSISQAFNASSVCPRNMVLWELLQTLNTEHIMSTFLVQWRQYMETDAGTDLTTCIWQINWNDETTKAYFFAELHFNAFAWIQLYWQTVLDPTPLLIHIYNIS